MGHHREALASDRLCQSPNSSISNHPEKSAVKLVIRGAQTLTATRLRSTVFTKRIRNLCHRDFPTSNRFDETCEISRFLVVNRPDEAFAGSDCNFPGPAEVWPKINKE
jgi:hypothetical protein